jgi:hypothetical protein
MAERARFLAPAAARTQSAADPFAGYTATEVSWIREYDKLKRENRNPARRRELRDLMTEQRKRIWRKAQDPVNGGDGLGWDHRARRERYHSLLARTRTG